MLKATTTVPGLRNNITGNEKSQAEAGGRPNFRTTGYSQSNATTDGQRQFTLNGQVIQVLTSSTLQTVMVGNLLQIQILCKP